MNKLSTLVAAAAFTLFGGAAHAVVVDGTITFASDFDVDSGNDVGPGEDLSFVLNSTASGTGVYSALGAIDLSAFGMTFDTGSSSNGSFFTAVIDGDLTTFTVTETVIASAVSGVFGGWQLAGYLSVSGAGVPPLGSTASFNITASSVVDGGISSFYIQTPPEDLTPIPLPAGLPLMAGGLGVLILMRRRAS